MKLEDTHLYIAPDINRGYNQKAEFNQVKLKIV